MACVLSYILAVVLSYIFQERDSEGFQSILALVGLIVFITLFASMCK